MKIDAEKLEKGIDGLSSVCDKGKDEIRTLFKEGFGVEFKIQTPSVAKPGEFYLLKDGEFKDEVHVVATCFDGYSLVSLTDGRAWGGLKKSLLLQDLASDTEAERWKKVEVDIRVRE